jgi:RHH-type proline utilization regulon transcriptional repressor/proline dehydrogenase/delta 1-pyrroline-5-carboxylate dehydrogenase
LAVVAVVAPPLEAEVTELARRIAELGSGERARVYRLSWWSERMLAWAMANPSFKTQLFRLVDVFPATTGDADALRHLHEYFAGADAPRLLDVGVGVAEHLPRGERLSAAVARRNIARMAQQFIVGTTPTEVADRLGRLWRAGTASTVDLLGEKTLTAAEADRYAARVDELLRVLLDASAGWAPDDHLERDDLGPLPRVSVSIKPSALAPMFAPLTGAEALAQAADRLRPLLKLAVDRGAFVWLDTEDYDAKELTFELFRRLLDEPDLARLDAGVVVQAYLKEAAADLADLVAWSARRTATVAGARPIGVRLVKGAYWDAETVQARAEGWAVPVFEDKGQTDANYERCSRLLHDHHGKVRAAFGSHNLRSLAYAIAYARHLGIPDTGYELQMLYGMAEPVHAAIGRLGLRLRVYAPMGELVPGMSYLVRRLLENTSNESFVRRQYAQGRPGRPAREASRPGRAAREVSRSLDELLVPPTEAELPGPSLPATRPATDPSDPGPYRHEPVAEWRRAGVRSAFGAAVDDRHRNLELEHEGPLDVPAVIDGQKVHTRQTIASVDPAQCNRVVATSASCGPDEADRAVEVASRAWDEWRRTPTRERAAVLFRLAEWMRARRNDLATLEIFEAGKPWAEADADVCEAIDFCEYYGREMLDLSRRGVVESPPGETNRLSYQSRGVGVVIAPWNFPLAIPTGMVTGALVAGNPVILKPAEQAPAVASMLIEGLAAAGLPPGVVGFLPGVGEVVGAHLVAHPGVSFVVFTGSKAVGLAVNAAAAQHRPGQRHVKRVVAEMGGKNAVVVDADADLDQAVPAVVRSAFTYAGQKCSAASRLIVLEPVFDELMTRLGGAVLELKIGHPRHMATDVGPLIDADAQARVRAYTEMAHAHGRVALGREDVPATGYFAGPVVVADVAPDSPLVRDEIFGPVLAVLRASSFSEALALANDTDYALTAGVFSRSPAHIALASNELRAGNVYINRGITGAVVGRQPFGGYGMSGVGSKSGGPDYLLQFVDPRVTTENTLRRGFAPDGSEGA